MFGKSGWPLQLYHNMSVWKNQQSGKIWTFSGKNEGKIRRAQKSPTPRKRPLSNTYPTFWNKSHTGRYTAKQRVYCSQYRFWLSLTIAEHKHNLQTPLNTGYRLQTATNAQHRANTFGRVLTLLSSTNRTQGDTRQNRVLTSLFT